MNAPPAARWLIVCLKLNKIVLCFKVGIRGESVAGRLKNSHITHGAAVVAATADPASHHRRSSRRHFSWLLLRRLVVFSNLSTIRFIIVRLREYQKIKK